MSGLLRSVYRSLPLIRGLGQIRDTLYQMDRRQQQLLLSQLDEYTRRLLQDERYSSPERLNRYEMQVYSEGGKDGILGEIFRRIGVASRTLVEIGVGDGLQNNTAFLVLQNWRAFWIEGDDRAVETISRILRTPIAEGRLKVVRSFVTAENIADTLRQMEVPEEMEFAVSGHRPQYLWGVGRPVQAARASRGGGIQCDPTTRRGLESRVPCRARLEWHGLLRGRSQSLRTARTQVRSPNLLQ